ncbi:MAG TPA: hypothetical protein VFU41_09685 [Gemmatimonadales bacterium]|nr:hypothetical protein [Gemmatimonadales bacterium]
MMRPSLVVPLAAALLGACVDTSNPGTPFLVVSPILDSLFVRDTLDLTVTYFDANGQPQPPGPLAWSIDPDTVAEIDAATGRVVGLKRGAAIAYAQAGGVSAPARALIIVSDSLDLTLLLDTVYVMPGDTITLPRAVLQKAPVTTPATVSFSPSPDPARYTIDEASGLVTAVQPGNPVDYVAHVTDGTRTVSDTGAIHVMTLVGLTAGRGFFTVLGTAIRHEGGPARAMNYAKAGGGLAFRLVDSLIIGNTFYEKLTITLPDAVTGTGTFTIDSLNPAEAPEGSSCIPAVSNPPRPWALWHSIRPGPEIRAFSRHPVGELSVTRYEQVTGGYAISGRYLFRAQRTEFYSDPLGALTIRGTFVAPLITNQPTCQP